jgi:hypothetical protein
MGIMDTVLRPHLEALTKFSRDNELLWFSVIEAHKEDVNADQKAKLKRLRLDQESEIFRQQGNQYFKAHDFNQALHFYTKSIAAAIQGPLASLAYFNRWIISFSI